MAYGYAIHWKAHEARKRVVYVITSLVRFPVHISAIVGRDDTCTVKLIYMITIPNESRYCKRVSLIGNANAVAVDMLIAVSAVTALRLR